MKNYKAILFDMDGTLIPMDMEAFTHGYFKLLTKKLAPFGIPNEKLVPAIWQATGCMIRNDGSVSNKQAFWINFEKITGVPKHVIAETCEDFYGREFDQARVFTGENPLVREAIAAAREKAPIVALATNPLFPMAGQRTRMNWVGIKAEDFDLVTSYESDRYCKPNPQYYISVCERLGAAPEECLMIGNDELEDMYAASSTGMDCYLVTDSVIMNEDHPWQGPKGTFAEMIEMLRAL